MAKAKPIRIFNISNGYSRCVVWHGSPASHDRIRVSVLTPDKDLTRKQKWETISRWLFGMFDITWPHYKPTKRERG